MGERYCTEYMFVGSYGMMKGWALIDRRQGYYNPLGYIVEANMAQKIVDALNKTDSIDVSTERTA